MEKVKIGFIGGGRVAKIIIGGLVNGGEDISGITVFDIDSNQTAKLLELHPEITITDDIKNAASCNIVFIGLHPPVIKDVLENIKDYITKETIIISLAPKIKLSLIQSILETPNVAKLLPNAPSIVNAGYNPVVYSESMSEETINFLENFFDIFGSHPIVDEDKIESYAVLSAMGPTYFWFQFFELLDFAKWTGLGCGDSEDAFISMINGAVETMFNSGLSKEEIMDLVASKPIKDNEETIKNIYREKLSEIYKKLKN